MTRKQNNFGTRYGNEENITEKLNESAIWKKLEDLEEGPTAKIHLDLLGTTLKKYQIRERQATMVYMDTG